MLTFNNYVHTRWKHQVENKLLLGMKSKRQMNALIKKFKKSIYPFHHSPLRNEIVYHVTLHVPPKKNIAKRIHPT